jgi:hypothetical protein
MFRTDKSMGLGASASDRTGAIWAAVFTYPERKTLGPMFAPEALFNSRMADRGGDDG